MIKTHRAILDGICQFETETERVLSTAFVKTMDMKTVSLTFGQDPQNENHEVDIHIMTSEEELEKLARRRDIKLHVPPQKDDHTEPKHVQQDYLINTLQASKHYSSLLMYPDYIEANHDILNLLNKDWKSSTHYPYACI